MAKNKYIIIRISLETPTRENMPAVIFANKPVHVLAEGDFHKNHVYTNKRKARNMAATLNRCYSESAQVSYKVLQIKEVA